jgi:hypothetical protein
VILRNARCNNEDIYTYLKCIVYDKLWKLRQSFRVTLYLNIFASSVLCMSYDDHNQHILFFSNSINRLVFLSVTALSLCEVGTEVLYISFRRTKPASHRGVPCSIPYHYMWDSWWKKWYWDRFSSQLLRFFPCQHHFTDTPYIGPHVTPKEGRMSKRSLDYSKKQSTFENRVLC